MQTPVRILVVDDAEPVRKILVQTLRAMGFDPSQADSGPAALRLVLTAPPDVAIVDQRMPDMTGAELVRLMRSSTDARIRSIAIIGLSALVRAASVSYSRLVPSRSFRSPSASPSSPPPYDSPWSPSPGRLVSGLRGRETIPEPARRTLPACVPRLRSRSRLEHDLRSG